MTLLRIDGEVESPVEVGWDDLHGMPADDLISDVSVLEATRRGEAVRLAAVLGLARPKPAATHITLHGSADRFSASLPIDEVRDEAVLIYGIEGRPLSPDDGGPIRFLIPNAPTCKTADVDACANVKFLNRIEFTSGKVADSRG